MQEFECRWISSGSSMAWNKTPTSGWAKAHPTAFAHPLIRSFLIND